MRTRRIAFILAAVAVLSAVLVVVTSHNLKVRRLVNAVRSGDESTVNRILQDVPEAVNAMFPLGRRSGTLLHAASMKQQPNIVRILIEHGANVNLSGEYAESPLYVAATYNCPGCVKLLLEAGADVNARGGMGRTPLMTAVISGSDSDIIEMLLRSGATPDLADDLGTTALQMATMYGQTNCVTILSKRSQ